MTLADGRYRAGEVLCVAQVNLGAAVIPGFSAVAGVAKWLVLSVILHRR